MALQINALNHQKQWHDINIDVNTIMFNSSSEKVAGQLWRVVHAFHMGEYVKKLLEERHINTSSLAKAMGIKPNSFPSYYDSKVIKDEVLIKMTNALGWDLYGNVKQEQARRMVGPMAKAEVVGEPGIPSTVTMDAPIAYKRRPPSAPDTGLVMMLPLDEYPEEVQLKILRFLQQQPKRHPGGMAHTG